MAKQHVATGWLYRSNMMLFLAGIGFGVAFIVLSMSSRFYKWKMDDCFVTGAHPTGVTATYQIDLTADVGWYEFTASYVDPSAADDCFEGISQGQTYALSDYQDNSAMPAGLGMVASWAVATIVGLYTVPAMFRARNGMRNGGPSLVFLMKLTALFTLGIIAATTVFWWMVEGKFGNRRDALVPRLREIVLEAAQKCGDTVGVENACIDVDWEIETPGLALYFGITAMFAYGVAVVMLWWTAARVDAMNDGSGDELAEVEPAKPAVSAIVEKAPQPEEKARAKDRRSAKTGVRANGRAPSSTTPGDSQATPDPMTYALEEGIEEEMGSQDDESEVVYHNHQVHHSVVNHSQPNPTQVVEDSRRQQQYQRGYSRGTSQGSYRSAAGRSFDERSEAEYSEAASSAQYYGNNQGRSFMSSSSQGQSFDDAQ